MLFRSFYNEARKCLTESKFLEDYIQKQLLQESQVIACTPVISASYLLKEKSFETLFFDEASQALEPMTWIPLIKSNRVIFAGDHFQLPPVVKSRDAIQGGLSKTMLERCIKFADCSELLNKQYRMHHQIMEFSNNYFYEGKLEADITVKDTVISRNENDELLSTALEFIDTAGCGFEEQINLETLSSFNPDEVKLLFKHLRKLSGKYLKEFDKNNFDLSVGIITPYRHQQEFLRQELNSEILDDTVKRNIEIKTIDGFQGEEKDIIYISFVRSNQKGEIGFLSDVRRTNVAITRAKKKLIMIGDSATLASNEFYRKLIEYCETKNAYSSAWNLVNEE